MFCSIININKAHQAFNREQRLCDYCVSHISAGALNCFLSCIRNYYVDKSVKKLTLKA